MFEPELYFRDFILWTHLVAVFWFIGLIFVNIVAALTDRRVWGSENLSFEIKTQLNGSNWWEKCYRNASNPQMSGIIFKDSATKYKTTILAM